MILPERVLGSAGVKWILSGRGERADVVAHFLVQLLAQRVVPSSPAFRVTNA